MKFLLTSIIITLSTLANASELAGTSSVNYLYIDSDACRGINNYSGIIAEGFSILVAELSFGDSNQSTKLNARPFLIKSEVLNVLCSDWQNRYKYRLYIENLGSFNGGVVIDIESNTQPNRYPLSSVSVGSSANTGKLQ